ncbi:MULTISPECIES: murein L,D-transpeptidase family protein [unclassified Halomonas]|uniref:L,D-transpeptidase family protein n=1 Tax=unclassified Halomonas TaxID=2609666 RepID=UPI0020A21191|nr:MULTISPECIES: L,D-transpeptidase [unclassified Halomonas]MCP1314751.1 L,D-transpeptidase [Halomonas sp. 707D7]MCP1327491.1 L,D-transpeptidase [Halomonas sp. 707D4]
MPLNRRRFLALAMGWPAMASASVNAPASTYQPSDLIRTLLDSAAKPRHSNELWVLIDDRESVLSVFRGDALIERYAPISLGRGGARTQRVRGDNTTPLGEFRVYRFNRESRWHIFIGIDYPTPPHARMALEAGIYSQADYEAYFDAYRRFGYPPQETALGGAIGIHGLGSADPEIHGRYHWTQGCIAVTNEQIERIASLVDVGTRVVIR